jgi:hypothetical protein
MSPSHPLGALRLRASATASVQFFLAVAELLASAAAKANGEGA